MRKIIMALIGLLVLLAACTSNDNDQKSNDTEKEVNTESSEGVEDSASNDDEETDTKSKPKKEGSTSFPESKVLAEEINMESLEAEIKTDNPNNRVMILKDEDGNEKYKSVYIKEKNRLKIISLNDEGQIFNKVIEPEDENNAKGSSSNEETHKKFNSKNEELTSFSEYKVLAVEINMENLDAEIKTDNPNNRVMILKDEDGNKKYKSVYIKKKERLKIISLDDEGQVFNKIIK